MPDAAPSPSPDDTVAESTAVASRRQSSTQERREDGQAKRARVPRKSLGVRSTRPRDPLGILDRQNAARVADLVPMRTERMSESPFAFFRGSAAVMAADLAEDPHTGIMVASCGDAHVANFGFYASPQRTLVFDLNDFDEAAWAPWEWDLKRLVTSIVIGGQATARDDAVIRSAARSAVGSYARTIALSSRKSPAERYFEHFDVDSARKGMDAKSRKALKNAIDDAERRTTERAVRKLTETGPDGRLRFVERPPTMRHVSPEILASVRDLNVQYAESANVDIAILVNQYDAVDVCMRVVGVGSVGTRCYLVAYEDGDGNALILQAKEATRSVLEEFGGIRQPAVLQRLIAERGHGARVVSLQRVLQSFSDPFLGHVQTGVRDLYIRQFHDMKGGIEVETLDDDPFVTYASSCAAILARAHGQSTNAAVVSGYIGNGQIMAESITEWAYTYAAQSRNDYEAFIARVGQDSSVSGSEPSTV